MTNNLQITEPLEFRIEKIFGPYSSDEYLHPKYSRLVGISSLSIIVNLKWVLDPETPENTKLESQIRFPADHWRSEEIKVLAPYFYVQIMKPDGMAQQEHTSMKLEFFTMRKRGSIPLPEIPKNVESSDEPVKVKERRVSFDDFSERSTPKDSTEMVIIEDGNTVQRTKSPFKTRLFGKKKFEVGSVKLPLPSTDFRIPSYIAEGAILLGGKNGRFELLPRGHSPGMYLMINEEGKPEWRLPYPPTK